MTPDAPAAEYAAAWRRDVPRCCICDWRPRWRRSDLAAAPRYVRTRPDPNCPWHRRYQ